MAVAIELRPRLQLYHALAALLVAENEIDAYRKLCPEIIARFAGTTNASAADIIVKDCLILPSPGVDLERIAVLAEYAVTRGKGESPYTFYLCSKALADYRRGKLQEALALTSVILKDPFSYTQAEGSAVRAMSQFRMGETAEARATLASLEIIVQKKLPALRSHNLGGDWRDWIISHALLEEAKSMIQGPTSTNIDWRKSNE